MVTIDRDRLWKSLQTLGEIGKIEDSAIMRVTGSEADGRARDQVVEWFEDAGLEVRVDPVGNVAARYEGTHDLSPVVTGSHLDTVPHGGKFDGAAGVLAGLEIVRAWNNAGVEPARPLDVVIFTEEEGTRFGTGLLGSQVAAGQLSIKKALTLEDDEGDTVGEVLTDIGYRGNDDIHLEETAAFVELHVEQGPRLEATETDVGVVESIAGIQHGQVTFEGKADHAGTTPMDRRWDAFMGVAEFALELERTTRAQARKTAAVGTVGKVDVYPNGTNVVPGHVDIGVDIRDTNEAAKQKIIDRIRAYGSDVAAERELDFRWETLLDVPATPMSDEVVATLKATADDLSAKTMWMPSGAGHDAMNVADVAPTGMLFVPSKGGISHNPNEYTAPKELATGASVLERTLRQLATE